MKFPQKLSLYDLRLKYFQDKGFKEKILSFLRVTMVKIYQNLGMFILLILLFVIIGYFLSIAFFFFNRHWVVPFIVNPFSEKVLMMRKQHMNTVLEVDTLETKKFIVQKKLSLLQKKLLTLDQLNLDLQKIFQQEIKEKMDSLKRLNSIHDNFYQASQALLKTSSPSLKLAKKMSQQVQEDYKTGLLTTDQFLQSQGELWQNQSSHIDFDLKMHDLEVRIQKTKKELSSMSKMENGSTLEKSLPLSYEIMLMKKQRDLGIEERSNVEIEIHSLQQEFKGLDHLINEQRDFSRIIVQSPYFQAFGQNMVLGFVPYEHLKSIKVHDGIYACKFRIFWCDLIGQVKKIHEGEVTQTHPFFSKEIRGKILGMDLHQVNLGQNDILHVGRPPFFLIF